MERKGTLIKGILVVVFFLIGSKLFSFLIEMLIAYSLGATMESDIYYLVYGIYAIISPMISIGIWKVYMPAYKGYCVVNKHEVATQVTDKLLTVFLFVSLLIIILINAFPKAILKVFAPGFAADSVIQAIPLLRWVSLLFFFTTIHTFSSAILQSNNKFEKSQIKGIIQHIPSLIYLIVFRDKVSIYGLVLSIVCGEILTMVVMQILVKPFYSFTCRAKIFDFEIRKILKTVPVACAIAIINQINGIVDKAFASTLQAGAITCLNYGAKLNGFFDGIFSVAISTAVFPTLTELVVKNEERNIREFLRKYLTILAGGVIFVTSLLMSFSNEIVSLLFERGVFDAGSVQMTANILSIYSLGLLALSFNTIINDVLYIRKQTNLLLITTIVNVLLNIILNALFVVRYGVVGLSVATTIALYITLVIKLVYSRKFVVIEIGVYKNIFALIIAGVCSYILAQMVSSIVENVWGRLFIGGSLSAIMFIAIILCKKDYRRMLVSGVRTVYARRKK